MTESALTGLIGALVAAVGALSLKIRHDGKEMRNGKEDRLLPTLERMKDATERQTEVMRELSEMMHIHNSESKFRHEILTTILAQLERRRD